MEEPIRYDDDDMDYQRNDDMQEHKEEMAGITTTNGVMKKAKRRNGRNNNRNSKLNKSMQEEANRYDKIEERGGDFVEARIEELVGKIRSKQDLYYVLHSEMKFYLPDIKH
jgi:hypothetical protein